MFGKSAVFSIKISKNLSYFIVSVFLMLMVSACSYDDVKRTAYESLYQRNCMSRNGVPNCEADHRSYDSYQYEREKSLQGK
ncbi:MAG: hypothetical protein ABL925_17840 [Methylococcales bacterium]